MTTLRRAVVLMAVAFLGACGGPAGQSDSGVGVALSVSLAGSGNGVVSSVPAGINCGSDCSEVYGSGTEVTLLASAAGSSSFVGWSGACSGSSSTCVVTLDAAKSVIATFAPPQQTVSVVKTGTGEGTVTSTPAGIACGADCSEAFEVGTMVTLSATPAAGSTFDGWTGGGCTGTGSCVVTVTGATAVVATFSPKTWEVTVTRSGTGSGSVASTPAGITCGADCTEPFVEGLTVVLTASPAAGSTFAGWTGACSGTGPCILSSLSAAATVDANFTLESYTLTVARAGTGSGTVTSSPAGLDCGTDCVESLPFGATVVLSATAAANSTFTGWSGGGCSGTAPCTVTMAAATTVVATFTLNSHALTVTRSGAGTGTVSSSPAGINCGSDCSETLNSGTVVVLTAAADTGSTFAGWSGACSGMGTCTVSINAATTVDASFTLNSYALTLTVTGNGSGTVTSSPAGIACGSDCDNNFDHGTSVTLTALPAANSTFAGWSGGGCTGTAPCTVAMTSATSITAVFSLASFVLTVAGAGTGVGTVTSSVAGINCGTDCTESFTWGTSVTLTATPGATSGFSGWSGGGCSGTGPCTIVISAAATVTATFGAITRLGNPVLFAQQAPLIGNYFTCERFTVGAAVTLRQLAVLATAGGPSVKLALYADSTGTPGALVAETSATTMVTGAMELDRVGGFLALPAGSYWLCGVYSANSYIGYRATGSSATTAYKVQTFTAPMPNPFGAPSGLGAFGESYNYYMVVH